jgi:hypothetical protein
LTHKDVFAEKSVVHSQNFELRVRLRQWHQQRLKRGLARGAFVDATESIVRCSTIRAVKGKVGLHIANLNQECGRARHNELFG